MEILTWLDTSPFSIWVNSSIWLYPSLLASHGLGMAVVVGLSAAMALRVLGFPKGIPLGAYLQALPFFIAGFTVNALSGIALFVAEASTIATNPSFQIKLVSIAVGLVVFWLLIKNVIRPAAEAEAAGQPDPPVGSAGKIYAVITLLIWTVAVIVSGRLIAYVSQTF